MSAQHAQAPKVDAELGHSMLSGQEMARTQQRYCQPSTEGAPRNNQGGVSGDIAVPGTLDP